MSAGLDASTATPGSTPPLESFTCPVRALWADASAGSRTTIPAVTTTVANSARSIGSPLRVTDVDRVADVRDGLSPAETTCQYWRGPRFRRHVLEESCARRTNIATSGCTGGFRDGISSTGSPWRRRGSGFGLRDS